MKHLIRVFIVVMFAWVSVAVAADGPDFYVSLHAGVGGFRSQFDVRGAQVDPVLLSFGTYGAAGRFRVYIPPGARQINMNFFAPNGALVGAVARFQVPPELNYCGVRAANWSGLPWKSAATLASLTAQDFQFQNMGVSFFPIVQVIKAGLAAGGWLYFKVLDVDDSNDVFQFQYVVQVVREPFLKWYDSAQWDGSGDPLPITGAAPHDPTSPDVWGCSGGQEPVPTPGPQPQPGPGPQPQPGPVPTPQPQPTPSPSRCTEYTVLSPEWFECMRKPPEPVPGPGPELCPRQFIEVGKDYRFTLPAQFGGDRYEVRFVYDGGCWKIEAMKGVDK